MGRWHRTPEEQEWIDFLNDDRARVRHEYERSYDILRAAMALFDEPDLLTLKNAMYFAHSFLDEEMDHEPELVSDLGLDAWIAHEKEEERRRIEEEAEIEEERRELEEEMRELEEQEAMGEEDSMDDA